MSTLFKLLEDKLHWYRKYLGCNEAYLMALRHAPDIALDEVELFYGNRESLLKILEDLDRKIQTKINTDKRESNTDERTKIQYYIREKDSIIERIVELDTAILSLMDSLKEQGAEKIKALSNGKKVLSKYKSSTTKNDKLDKRV